MRFLAALLLAATLVAAPAQQDDITLCAKVGSLQKTRGNAISFGRYLVPSLWSVRRDVKFQVCSPEGKPIAGSYALEVAVQALTPEIGESQHITQSVITDENGRFSGMYGVGRRAEGSPWPEGQPKAELHHFRWKGRTIAAFVLELEPRDVRFYPRTTPIR